MSEFDTESQSLKVRQLLLQQLRLGNMPRSKARQEPVKILIVTWQLTPRDYTYRPLLPLKSVC